MPGVNAWYKPHALLLRQCRTCRRARVGHSGASLGSSRLAEPIRARYRHVTLAPYGNGGQLGGNGGHGRTLSVPARYA
eukprot:1455053-Rhodomonas_salina.1